MSTHYDTLGVAHTAPVTVIRSAYRAIMRDVHPDAAGGGDTDLAQRVNEAYGVLSDPGRRAAYDRELNVTGSPFLGATTSPGDNAAPSTTPSAHKAPHDVGKTVQEPEPTISFAWYAADEHARKIPWWRRIAVIVVTVLWVLAAATLVLLATEPTRLAALGVIALMITAHLVLYLRRKVLLTLLLAAGCAGMFMVTPARDLEPGWAWLALAIGLVAIVGPCWGLFKVIDTFETAAVRVGQFWAAAEMPGATAWFVAAVERESTRRSLCLLDSVGLPGQEARATRSLWGSIPQGAYILLDGSHDEPTLTVSNWDMRAGTKLITLRSHLRKRSRT
ncbi:J domain-containing protein [Microbacterium xylanilyticum]